jgi:hypothetical protein
VRGELGLGPRHKGDQQLAIGNQQLAAETMNPRNWGVGLAEQRVEHWPPDWRFQAFPDETWFRGITVNAPRASVFRWLCQLRVAPYSYDWIDNWARRSPRQLIKGMDQLALGQPVMTIFELSSYELDHFISITPRKSRSFDALFGQAAITYRCSSIQPACTRLLVRLRWRFPRNFSTPLIQLLLPLGDLFMMRKQLRTLKQLAEAR